MITYKICNFEHSKDFIVDNVFFKGVNDYDNKVSKLEERKDQVTFQATVQSARLSRSSKFFPNKPATSVNDIMILLSLAQSRNIFYPSAVNERSRETWGMPLGGERQSTGFKLIMEHEIENFLESSLQQIRKANWLDKTGFVPAVFWWLESIYINRPLETKFVSAFVSLEVLANACYGKSSFLSRPVFKLLRESIVKSIDELKEVNDTAVEFVKARIPDLNHASIREKMVNLKEVYNWNFISDLMVRDWVNIRNKYMHEGSTKELKNIDKQLLATRFFQLTNSIQMGLIEMLGFKNFNRREYIITEIAEPLRKIIRVGGPFHVTT